MADLVPSEAGIAAGAAAGAASREALWDAVRSALRAQREGQPLERIRRDRAPIASFAQRRLWFLERLTPGSATHNQTVALRLTGTLAVAALEASFGEIARRHEALRTTLFWSDGELLQRIHPPAPFAIRVRDLSAASAATRAAQADEEIAQEAREPFDIERPPLLRALLVRLADDEHRLAVTVHHLAFDGWSFAVFMRELGALYAAYVAGVPSPLGELRVQYADYAAWQRTRLDDARLERLLAYWTHQMRAPLTVLRMPADRPRRSRRQRRGEWLPFALASRPAEALKRLAADDGATLYMVLLAALQALLHRYTGERDIVVGSPVANRHAADVERLIGLVVNTLAMRTRIDADETFRELLRRVRETALDAYEHQELPFELLVDALGAASRSDATPVFQVMFAFQNLPRWSWESPRLSAQAWNVGNGCAKFDLTLFAWEEPGGIGGLLEYDADLFEEATAAQWLRHFRVLLEAIAHDPNRTIAKLPLVDAEERLQLMAIGNGPVAPYPRNQSIQQVFAARTAEDPRAVALAFDGGTIDYGELDRDSNRLARHLQQRGVARGTLVGVRIERSPALIVTLLAVLKAGGAYVPVETGWPAARIARMLERVAIVVTEGAWVAGVAAPGREVVDLERDAGAIARAGDDPLDVVADPADVACVMCTSGSTGTPKGVCVSHRGIVRLVRGANYDEIARTDVFLALSPVSFDGASFEIWGALLNGATLAVAPAAQPSLAAIARAVERHRVSVLFVASGLFEAFVDSGAAATLASVRRMLVGGDVLSVPHVERFLRELPTCRLVNCYGPTENTTFTTFHPVRSQGVAHGESIPIGQPISNACVRVLDAALEPVPIGVAGEAYVGGDGLMRGYLDDPTATSAQLIADPADENPTAYLYRTGDIVRWRRDGMLEFLGRHDDQIKVRGFRVEPAEIESALNGCPAVRRAAVVADGMDAGKRLVAFVVPTSSSETPAVRAREIRSYLRERVPDYLVPSEFVEVDAIPFGPNGKVDRARLRALCARVPAPTDAYTAPRNARERTVVEAFEQALGRHPIGVDQDFLDAGGSSLSALRLVAMLEAAFAVDIPLVTLYEHPTPAALAAAIAELDAARPHASATRRGSSLVEIRRGKAAVPLFLIPGGHGGMAEMTLYAKALKDLRRDRPIYGVLARGIDGREPPHPSVAAMAEAYIADIRRFQPHGPYALAGECVGGLIAYEMAQQLVAQRHEVALLVLLDTWCPTLAGVIHYRYVERVATILAARSAVARRGLAEVGQVLHDHVRDRPPFTPLGSLRYAVNVARTLVRVGRPWLSAVNAVGRPAPGAERIFAAEANYIERTMRYRPHPYPGRVSLIVSAANARQGLANPWRALAGGGLAVREVPGDHDSYLRDTPESTVPALEACIDEALGAAAESGSRTARGDDR